jgi:hypothetical protein
MIPSFREITGGNFSTNFSLSSGQHYGKQDTEENAPAFCRRPKGIGKGQRRHRELFLISTVREL